MLAKIWAFILSLLKPKPPADPGYVVRVGNRQERTLKVPCSVEFSITGKKPGTAEREEVTIWAYSAGGDWHGGNPAPGTFGVRCNDSRPDWAKLKVAGVSGYAGEPPLKMAWAEKETFLLRLEVDVGRVTWTARRASDGAMATARIDCDTPPLVTIGIGDPPNSSRKAAEGAIERNIVWSGEP